MVSPPCMSNTHCFGSNCKPSLQCHTEITLASWPFSLHRKTFHKKRRQHTAPNKEGASLLSLRSKGKAIFTADALENLDTRTWRALLSVEIDRRQPETGLCPQRPLKIVQQSPVEI